MDQYWNAYSYCGADPVNYVDEWGLEGEGNYTVKGENGNTEYWGPATVQGDGYRGETGPGSGNSNTNQDRDGLPTIVSNNSFVDNLRRAYERQQAAYGNEGVEADPFIPSPIIFGTLARNAGKSGKNVFTNGDDVVDDAVDIGKNLVKAAKDKLDDVIEETTRVVHFTNKKGIEGIKNDGLINAKDQNSVFTVTAKGKPGSPTDVEKSLGIKPGRANFYVEFTVKRSEIVTIKNKLTKAIEKVFKGNVNLKEKNPTFHKTGK